MNPSRSSSVEETKASHITSRAIVLLVGLAVVAYAATKVVQNGSLPSIKEAVYQQKSSCAHVRCARPYCPRSNQWTPPGQCCLRCRPNPTCPPNQVFKTCGTACPKTCGNKDQPIICTRQCVRGCFCVSGFVLKNQNGRCVPVAACPKNNGESSQESSQGGSTTESSEKSSQGSVGSKSGKKGGGSSKKQSSKSVNSGSSKKGSGEGSKKNSGGKKSSGGSKKMKKGSGSSKKSKSSKSSKKSGSKRSAPGKSGKSGKSKTGKSGKSGKFGKSGKSKKSGHGGSWMEEGGF